MRCTHCRTNKDITIDKYNEPLCPFHLKERENKEEYEDFEGQDAEDRLFKELEQAEKPFNIFVEINKYFRKEK